MVRGQVSRERVDFTEHAVLRYIKRHRPELNFDQALAELQQRALDATPLKQRSITGEHLWRIEDPRVHLVIKPDAGVYVCVTVLPERAMGIAEEVVLDDEEAEELVAAYQRATAHLGPKQPPPAAPAPPPAAPPATSPAPGAAVQIAELRQEVTHLRAALERVTREKEALLADPRTFGSKERRSPQQLLLELEQGRARWARERERLLNHGDRMHRERNTFGRFLRRCLRVLATHRDLPDVDALLANIAAEDAGLLTTNFLDPKPGRSSTP